MQGKRRGRALRCESLESRSMMAADLVVHNFLQPHDVNDDRLVSPSDALRLINSLNAPSATDDPIFADVNDDSKLSPLDALVVINSLNTQGATTASQQARLAGKQAGVSARVELEVEGAEIEMSIRVLGGAAGSTHPVTLDNVLLGNMIIDSKGRGRMDLSRGDDNDKDLPLPPSITQLKPEMVLVIGDLVQSNLASLTGTGGTVGGGAGGGTGGNNQGSSEWLATPDVLGTMISKAEYEVEVEGGVTKRKFKVEVERAVSGSAIAIFVGDRQVGTLLTDSTGEGKLILTTDVRDSDEILMPSDFPAINEQTEVSIGGAKANFRKIG
jgi:hypothetical protein